MPSTIHFFLLLWVTLSNYNSNGVVSQDVVLDQDQSVRDHSLEATDISRPEDESATTSQLAEASIPDKRIRRKMSPCTSFTHYDPNHLTRNLLDLSRNPEAFIQNEMMAECNLEMIDLRTIVPKEKGSFVWITYMGDSLSRELFMGSVQGLSGYKPDGDWFRRIPLLGPHVGPRDDLEVDNFDNTYHQSKLLCCKSFEVYTSHSGVSFDSNEASSRCVYAMEWVQTYKSHKLEKFKDFLFKDIGEYIETQVKARMVSDFTCISFIWAPRYQMAADTLNRMAQFEVKPSAIILNLGLHQKNNHIAEQETLIAATENLHKSFGTQVIVHSPTTVNTEMSGWTGKVSQHIVDYGMMKLRQQIPSWDASGHERYLDIYNLSKALHLIPGCSRFDGIHFNCWCNYQAICTQWDFNWLKHMGIFR